MKKCMAVLTVLALTTGICNASWFFFGGHGGYTLGGDIEEEEAGGGVQLGFDFNDVVSLEAAGTLIADQLPSGEDMDLFLGALTLRLAAPMSETAAFYIGGGVSYNRFEPDRSSSDDDVGFHGCGGLEIALGENFELFAE